MGFSAFGAKRCFGPLLTAASTARSNRSQPSGSGSIPFPPWGRQRADFRGHRSGHAESIPFPRGGDKELTFYGIGRVMLVLSDEVLIGGAPGSTAGGSLASVPRRRA